MHHCNKGNHLLLKAGLTILRGKLVFVDKFTTKTCERKQNNGLFTMTAVWKELCVDTIMYVTETTIQDTCWA